VPISLYGKTTQLPVVLECILKGLLFGIHPDSFIYARLVIRCRRCDPFQSGQHRLVFKRLYLRWNQRKTDKARAGHPGIPSKPYPDPAAQGAAAGGIDEIPAQILQVDPVRVAVLLTNSWQNLATWPVLRWSPCPCRRRHTGVSDVPEACPTQAASRSPRKQEWISAQG